jgi:membrane protein required for colicin V production
MTWLDYALLGVIVISIAWGIWRGLVREVISLVGWIIAFLAANLLAGPLGEALPESWARADVRVLVAFVGIFIVALVITSLAGLLLGKILKAVGLGGIDRVLGGVFGLARGLVIAVAFALVAGLTPLPKQPVWTQAASRGLLEAAALALRPWLPPTLAERLRYR